MSDEAELSGVRMTRRRFIGGSMASAGVVLVGGTVLLACDPPPGTNPMRYELYKPQSLPGYNLSLAASPTVVDLGGGSMSSALGYNGSVPGPTISAVANSTPSIAFTNNLAQPTTVHWHGMIVPTAADGQPRDLVAPGDSYVYRFPVVQRAAMNWYHPHPHELTGKQVNLGLAGAFILRDNEESALGLPKNWKEVPLVIRDASFDAAGNFEYTHRSAGFMGKKPLVNGTRDARLGVDNAVYRFRILNGANARLFRLALDSGASFVLIGNDGGLLTSSATLTEIEIGPGERLDVLVDFRGLALGARVMLKDLNSGWDLLEFEVTRNAANGGTIPTGPLSVIEPLSNPVRTRQFSFDGHSRINGRTFDLDRVDFQVPFGETERWIFTTGGNAPHPVHVHGASFQVRSRSGGRGAVMAWEAGWKDTVLLLDGETVEVLVRFDAYAGLYLMHCHQLEHEDNGMMSNFEVV